MKKRMTFIGILLLTSYLALPSQACTRAVYLGPDNMVITGRTMDWKEDLKSNIYLFPRGIKRAGADSGNTIHWTSKYGSVITAGYDIGTSDGMNEKGLVANILYLTESSYDRPNDTRPVMGISIWTQYVLDNFATVDEAVKELRKELFPHRRSRHAKRIEIHTSSGNFGYKRQQCNLRIHQRQSCYSRRTPMSGNDQLSDLRTANHPQQLLETNRRLSHVTGNQPGSRPLCQSFLLHKRHPANRRSKRSSRRCIQCYAQCIGALGNLHPRSTQHCLYPLAYRL